MARRNDRNGDSLEAGGPARRLVRCDKCQTNLRGNGFQSYHRG